MVVQVLDLAEGSVFYTLHGHEGPALGVAFSAVGDQFASAGVDKAVLVWQTNFDAALATSVEGVATRCAGTSTANKPAPAKQQQVPWRHNGQRGCAAAPEAAKAPGARPKTAPVQQPTTAGDSIAAVHPACRQLQDGSHAAFESASLNTGHLPSSVADVLQTLVTSLDALTQVGHKALRRAVCWELCGKTTEIALPAAAECQHACASNCCTTWLPGADGGSDGGAADDSGGPGAAHGAGARTAACRAAAGAAGTGSNSAAARGGGGGGSRGAACCTAGGSCFCGPCLKEEVYMGDGGPRVLGLPTYQL